MTNEGGSDIAKTFNCKTDVDGNIIVYNATHIQKDVPASKNFSTIIGIEPKQRRLKGMLTMPEVNSIKSLRKDK